MSELLRTPAANYWIESAIKRHEGGIFGTCKPAVIWTDDEDDNGKLILQIDPLSLVQSINASSQILLNNHDPGRPLGQVIESAQFADDTGRVFVAAILGFYAGGDSRDFASLGIDVDVVIARPGKLPALQEDVRIQLGIDPRDVETSWSDSVMKDSPLPIERVELSLNTAKTAHELIIITIPYIFAVWNPFIKAIATEAGKATYLALDKWFRKLLTKLDERKNPLLEIQSFHNDCVMSFVLRGSDAKIIFPAREALPAAAEQAVHLARNLSERGMIAKKISYEFHKELLKWYPSYAILHDNRIITSSTALIATENLPTGLSIGFTRRYIAIPLTQPHNGSNEP